MNVSLEKEVEGMVLSNKKWEVQLKKPVSKQNVDELLEAVENMKVMLRDAGYEFANIWKASAKGNLEAVEFLVSKGISINQQNPGFYLETPLHYACVGGQHEMIQYLISQGADLDARSQLNEFTPLHYAVQKNDISTVDLVLQIIADKDYAEHREKGDSDAEASKGGTVKRGTLGKWLNSQLPSLKVQCGTTDMIGLLLDTLDEKERKQEQDERWRSLDKAADDKIDGWTVGWMAFIKKWMTPFQIIVIVCIVIFFIYQFYSEDPASPQGEL